MTARPGNIVEVTPDVVAEARAWMTPERRARLDALTGDDIAAQVASSEDAAPELDAGWFAGAQLVRPLKAAE